MVEPPSDPAPSGGWTRPVVVRLPPAEPNTSIDPARSEAICNEAIAALRSVHPPRGAPLIAGERDDAGNLIDDASTQDFALTEGLLSPRSIQRRMYDGLEQIAECEIPALRESPQLRGTIVTRFVIGPTGAVIAATVAQSSVTVRYLEQCVVNTLRNWTFDAPRNGGVVTVSYPLHFGEQ